MTYSLPEREVGASIVGAAVHLPLLCVSDVTISGEVERPRIIEHSQKNLLG